MSSLERFQNVVLGGGEAGKYIAWELARWGQPVAVVERGLIGGTCPNIACLPSKNVIHSAKVVGLVRRASTFGLRLGPWSVDMAGVRRRKRELVNGMIAIHKAQFAANGLEFILGEGRFVGPKTIEVRLTQGGRRCAAPSDP
jgi:pyruvate/2-oxoglutarate dehydrogenase complex dihydrolipoamide dehydrogenase (E3) component